MKKLLYSRRRFRAFTVMEAVIAGAIAMMLVAGMYSAFSMYFRSFNKEAAILDRSREVQQILSKMRVDFSTSVPVLITPDDLSVVPLDEMGWRQGPNALIELARDHVIYHVEFDDEDATKSVRTTAHAYSESYQVAKIETQWVAKINASGWQNNPPDPRVSKENIPGNPVAGGAQAAFVTVPSPLEGGEIRFFVSKGHDGLVVWAYQDHRKSGKRGRLLRWTAATGITDLGAGVVEMDAMQLRHEWIYIRPRGVKPERLWMQRTQLEVSVSLVGPAPGAPEKPGIPMLTMDAAIPREI